jgi:hypothetical protein
MRLIVVGASSISCQSPPRCRPVDASSESRVVGSWVGEFRLVSCRPSQGWKRLNADAFAADRICVYEERVLGRKVAYAKFHAAASIPR